jgi:S1-C subfamily serine protease
MEAPDVQVGGVGTRYRAEVVVFDPQRDLAVLAVPGLPASALTLGPDLGPRDDAVVAGFPLDGPFVASSARIRQVVQASGDDIYGRPGAVREVYSIYATVEPGNSGGPLLAPDGSLVGVVFAKSLDDPRTGYALTLAESEAVIRQGLAADSAVSTGRCAIG